MKQPLRVLIVEDNPLDAELVLRELRHTGFEPEWERVDTEAAFVQRLSSQYDIILSDFEMPGFNGLRALEFLLASGLDVPLILISGTIGEEAAVAAIRQGAADYLLKDRIARLGAAVRKAIQEVQDRSVRRQLQDQVIEAQKMEVIGQLAAGVAHDFNNVLAVVMSYCDLIKTDLSPDSPLQDYVNEILHASERGAGLTRQLLVFGRKQLVVPVVLDLDETIKATEPMLRRLISGNVDMEISRESHCGQVMADPGYVGQVLMNMVVNARDAMPNGGRLHIATHNTTLNSSYTEIHPETIPGDYVMISISDTGTGISEEVKARLFEAFFTTKPAGKGTGLGLATCQTIAKKSGGFIEVCSEVGHGSTFKVYFPRIKNELGKLARPQQDAPLPRGSETLLIVDDEAGLRHVASRGLERQGYQVLQASNGQDALNVAQSHRGSPIQLLITDIMMPVMGGEAAAAELKASYPNLKILFTSGYIDRSSPYNGRADEGIEFLPKPYTSAILARKVREMLDRQISPSLQKDESANPSPVLKIQP